MLWYRMVNVGFVHIQGIKLVITMYADVLESEGARPSAVTMWTIEQLEIILSKFLSLL